MPPSSEVFPLTSAADPALYLRRGAAGEPGQFADARCGCRVAGTDEHRRADLHGVTVLGCLGRLVGHGQGGEGVSLPGVLLGVRVFCSSAALRCCGRAFCGIHRHRRLIPLYQLLGSRVKLQKQPA